MEDGIVHSSLIGKIEKANRYAREIDRITFHGLDVEFRGDNDTHRVTLDADGWHCTCHFFASWGGACVHTLALQKILTVMLPTQAQTSLLAPLPDAPLAEAAAV
jgi:hypothetical protein